MADKIQLRRDTAADWTSTNPILADGEMGVETDTEQFKFGDGVTAWASLPYASSSVAVDTTAVRAAGALMDDEVDADLKTLSVPASTTVSAFGATLADDADAAAARATLGLDADLGSLSVPASTTVSAFGASLVDDASATSARTTLGLGNSATLDVGTVFNTVAAGDDARFGTVDIDDLAAAAALTGAELIPALQGAGGVQVTAADLQGGPSVDILTFAKNKARGSSGFFRVPVGFTSTSGGYVGLEPFVAYQSGAGAQIGCILFGVNLMTLTTGSTTTGVAAMANIFENWYAAATKSLDQRARFNLSIGAPATNGHTVYCGFANDISAADPLGAYFKCNPGGNTWHCIVRNAGGVEDQDSLVTVDTTPHVFRVFYDKAATAWKFYIDDMVTPVKTILNSTRVLADATAMKMICSIRNSSTGAARTMTVSGHSFEQDLGGTINV